VPAQQFARPHQDLFNAEIDRLDILQVIAAARAEFTRRKQEYLQKSKDR
jgi:hypothetical protein